MTVLIKQVRLISPSSPFNGQTKDILITDGIISSISDTISEKADQVIEENNLHVSIGWMDIFADFAEPGNEYRETLESGANAAAAGGFTDVMVMPNTSPVISSKAQIEFLKQRSQMLSVNVHPIGSVTKNTEGNELSEMYDMHAGGAAAFSDGKNSLQQAGVLLTTMQYTLANNAVIIQLQEHISINEES